MHAFGAGRHGLLGALCASLLSAAAIAAEPASRDETTLLIRTTAGQLERLRFEGELALGESRALTAESGNPASLTRNPSGMVLELAGERFEIALPSDLDLALELATDHDDAAHAGKRIVIEERQRPSDTEANTQTESRKIVRVIRHPQVDGAPAAADELLAGEHDPELLMLGGEGPRVVVMRKVVRQPAAQ